MISPITRSISLRKLHSHRFCGQLWMMVTAFAFIIFCRPDAARGDGGYIPPATFLTPPRIPGQTALLIHDGKMETLVVESTMEAGGAGRFAWVLPLPSPPEEIGKVMPGTLETLQSRVGPAIEGVEGRIGLGIHLFLAFAFSLALTFNLFRSQKSAGLVLKETWGRVWGYFFLLFIMDFLSMIAVGETPSPTAQAAGARALNRQRVGNYDVAVVRAKDKNELSRWLETHQFGGVPARAAQAVSDYAREGWVFLVARLERSEGKSLAPHPLKVRFKSAAAVYPMRLTAMAGGETEVDLYAVGNGRFSHPLLETMVADQFTTQTVDEYNSYFLTDDKIPRRVGMKTAAVFEQPELLRLIPAGMWITALRGKLQPEQMKEDLVLRNAGSASKADQKVFVTEEKALWEGIFRAMVAFTLISPLGAALCRRRGGGGELLYLLCPVLALGVLVVSVSIAPVMPNTVTFLGGKQLMHARMAESRMKIKTLYNEVAGDTTVAMKDKPDKLRERITREVRNPLEREPMREEASPGNFMVRVDAQGTIFVDLYNELGSPHEVAPGPKESRLPGTTAAEIARSKWEAKRKRDVKKRDEATSSRSPQ